MIVLFFSGVRILQQGSARCTPPGLQQPARSSMSTAVMERGSAPSARHCACSCTRICAYSMPHHAWFFPMLLHTHSNSWLDGTWHHASGCSRQPTRATPRQAGSEAGAWSWDGAGPTEPDLLVVCVGGLPRDRLKGGAPARRLAARRAGAALRHRQRRAPLQVRIHCEPGTCAEPSRQSCPARDRLQDGMAIAGRAGRQSH